MMKYLLYMSILLLLVASCKKEESNWSWCEDCNQATLAGVYKGKAINQAYQGEEIPWLKTDNLDITITIAEQNNNLLINAAIPNYLNRNFTVNYTGSYYLNYLTNFNATIWKNNDQLKLVGTIKSANEIMVYQIVDFEVYLTAEMD